MINVRASGCGGSAKMPFDVYLFSCATNGRNQSRTIRSRICQCARDSLPVHCRTIAAGDVWWLWRMDECGGLGMVGGGGGSHVVHTHSHKYNKSADFDTDLTSARCSRPPAFGASDHRINIMMDTCCECARARALACGLRNLWF